MKHLTSCLPYETVESLARAPESEPPRKLSGVERGPSSFTQNQLVWAKIRGYPYFPARVVNPKRLRDYERKTIPKQIVKGALAQNYIMVQFFDAEHNWAALSSGNLRILTSDCESDIRDLFGESKMKSKTETELRRAHAEALAYRAG